MTSIVEAARTRLAGIEPYYDPPEGDLKRFDQNVNLLGPHPAASRTPDMSGLNLYPSRDNRALVRALAQRFDVDEEQIVVGNGSDDILDIALRVLADPGQTLATPTPCYSMYARLAQLNRLRFVGVPTDEAFTPRTQDLLDANADILVLCDPNNPTGTLLPAGFLESVLDRFEGPVLVDEAYADFAGVDSTRRIDRFPNLIVIRTLSKAYGLAGLRVGYGIASLPVAELLRRMKPPFAVNLLSERIAIDALADQGPVQTAVDTVASERRRLQRELDRLGFVTVPSGANFLLAKPPVDAAALQAKLRDAGVLVRRYPQEPRLRAYLRFTLGGPSQTNELVQALEQALGSVEVRP